LSTESGEPQRRLAELIVAEAGRSPGDGRLVVAAKDWRTFPPQAYYLHGRRDVEVTYLSDWSVENTEEGRGRLREVLRGGGIVVHEAGGMGERHVWSLLPAACLLRWELPADSGERLVAAYRRNHHVPAPADYDGDGRADPAVFRAESGTWEIHLGGRVRRVRGPAGPAIPAPGDYDGDGRAEPALRRDGRPHREVLDGSETARQVAHPANDLPASGDFDGDGRSDVAGFSTAEALWHVRYSGGGERTVPLGRPGSAIPVPADFDGDGRADLAVFDPDSATFHVVHSSDGEAVSTQFGYPNMSIPVPADFDGDGRADPAVYLPLRAEWLVLGTSRGPTAERFGHGNRDIPVPADYDGDGRADPAVFRPEAGDWLIRGSRKGDREIAFAPASPGPAAGVAEGRAPRRGLSR
jgi:hypothetical protein